MNRSSRPVVFLGKGVLKASSTFTGEHPCRSVISIKLVCNFIEITLRHGCFPVNLPHIFRTPFSKNTSGQLLLLLILWKHYLSKSNAEKVSHPFIKTRASLARSDIYLRESLYISCLKRTNFLERIFKIHF